MDNNCLICYDTINGNSTRLTCNHEFHTYCLLKWKQDKCPLCKTVYLFSDFLIENPSTLDEKYINLNLYCVYFENRVKGTIFLEYYNEILYTINQLKYVNSDVTEHLDKILMTFSQLLLMIDY